MVLKEDMEEQKNRIQMALADSSVTVIHERNSSATPGPSSLSIHSRPIKHSMTVKEWCRLANISIDQNTKSRSLIGFRDDLGDHSPMYRYGIAQMIKLYCPKGVSLSYPFQFLMRI